MRVIFASTGFRCIPSPNCVQDSARLAEPYRRQISAILRLADYSRPYQTIYGITEQLGEVEGQAMAFLSGNDPHSALAILTEIADQTIPNYEQLEDEAQLPDYLTGWAKTMAETILSVELTPKEKAALTKWVAIFAEGLGHPDIAPQAWKAL